MNPRNGPLANELVKELFPAQHERALQDMRQGVRSATVDNIALTVQKIEGSLNAHNKTNFTDVGALNELIGNKYAEHGVEGLRRQLELVKEEFAELVDAAERYIDGIESVQKGDYTVEEVFGTNGCKEGRAALRKEAVDLHVVVYGLQYRLGVDADLDHAIEWSSQMSKFYHGDGAGAQVVADEIKRRTGLDVEVREPVLGTFAFVSAKEQRDIFGRDYPQGKQLKPHFFKKADFIA